MTTIIEAQYVGSKICLIIHRYVTGYSNPQPMRRSAILISIITLLAVTHCNKSKDPTPAPSLVGTWLMTTTAISGCTDTNQNKAEGPCGGPGYPCYTINFTDTMMTIAVTGASISQAYTVSGNTISWTDSSGPSSATYTVTSTTLTLTFTGTGGCIPVSKYTRQ